MGYKLTKEHGNNLPTIRITEIKLQNFKSVRSGTITFNCGKKHVPYGTASDILGIYGQNGSGKTSLVEAISILKHVMSGANVPDEYADCIEVGAEYAKLTFSFDLQYPEKNEYPSNGDIRKVVYSFKFARVKKGEEDEEQPHVFKNEELDDYIPANDYKVRVFDEILKVSGTICGQSGTLKPFLDTSNPKAFVDPKPKAEILLGKMDEQKKIRLGIIKAKAEEKSKSFIFMMDTMEIFSEWGEYSPYYQMLVELRHYAKYYLFVIDSKSTGLIRLNFMLPIFTRKQLQLVPIGKRFQTSSEALEEMTACFNSLSLVLTQIVPGLTVSVKDYGESLAKEGKTIHIVELIARRGDLEIPLRCESDGVRKLISTLHLLIMVYNQQSFTVAFDEFDAGIFEYLLGEILLVIQSSGKGQFIFTSHNMRPLEVLKKEFIWFTTTDKDHRYVKLTGLGESNNLRKVYYREIAMQEHYDNLYTETKRNMIISAMRKAGEK